MSGCGSEDGFPPVLTEVITPRTLPVQYIFDFLDGEAPLVGEVGFEDPDGDVVLMSITWQECGQGPTKKLEIVQEDLKRTKVGEIPFFVGVPTNCPIGVYTVNLTLTDGRGYKSNVLAVPYEIYGPLE